MDSVIGDQESSSDSGDDSINVSHEQPQEEAPAEEVMSESSPGLEHHITSADESWNNEGRLENAAQGMVSCDVAGESKALPQEENSGEYLGQDQYQQNETQENPSVPKGDEDYVQHDYAEQDNVTDGIEVPVQEELVLGEGQQEDLENEDFNLVYDPGMNEESEEEASVHDEIGQNKETPADERNEESEEDFDNVVEVEELKPGSDAEDDNTAQHISDSEDEEDERRMEGYKLDDNSDADLVESEKENVVKEDQASSPKMTNPILSSDEDDVASKDDTTKEKHEAAMKMFDSDSEEEKEEVGNLIADIFGESDDEGEEFTGFGAEEVEEKKQVETVSVKSDSEEDTDGWNSRQMYQKSQIQEEDDSDGEVRSSGMQGMSDFDIMLAKKKEENRRHRKRRDNSTFISDADDIINAMLTKMKEAAEIDREANLHRKPALKKLKMLPTVISHLKKQNLKELFVDNGVIAAIADWLSILPDRSLPHITIRTELLQVLHDLPSVGPETLKHSGIGKAVMILFKHPKESRQNKDSAGRLINKWSRPIFGLNENFKSMSREEREQRDLEQMPQAKRKKLTGASQSEQGEEPRSETELGHLRPGEAGFIMRARVPMPSTKDYVVRPKWNVEVDDERDDDGSDTPKAIPKRRRSAGAPRSSRKDERLEKHMRNFAERKKSSKMQRAVKISIEGNKMSIL